MKPAYTRMLGIGLLAALLAGCEDQKTERPVEMAPATDQTEAPLAPFPEDQVPAPEPQPARQAPAAQAQTPRTAQQPDVYQPPEEVTAIPPEPVDRAPAARPRQAPRESYAPATPRSGQTYTVKKGDTLQQISQKYYNTTRRWRRIYEANRNVLKDGPDKLSVGMKLVIPPG